MKINIKKMVSTVIVFAMLAAMLPQIAFAADVIESTPGSEAVTYTKLAEWTPQEIVNTNQVVNNVNSANPLQLANTNYNPPTQILPVSDAEYSTKNYIRPHNSMYGKYDVVNAGALAIQMNESFTLESWFKPGDGASGTAPGLMTVTDANNNVKFRVRWALHDTIQAKYIEVERVGENSSSVYLRGCNYGTDNRLSYTRWNHIAVTVGANSSEGTLDDVKLYLNGVEQTLTAVDATNAKSVPLAFAETDKIYFHGNPGAWVSNKMLLSDTAIYGGRFEEADALARYTEAFPYYETMFDSKLYDAEGTVYALDELNSLEAEEISKFTVDVTEAAANVTKDNFEIYNVTDDDTVDFTLSNEGTVYTLSDFTLGYGKDYKFIIKDITDADGKAIRTTSQVLNVKTVMPAIKNKIAEWIPDKIINQKIANTVDASNSLNVHNWSTTPSVNSVIYSKVNYIDSKANAKYVVDNGGTLVTKMNSGFTFETWVKLADTAWSVDKYARLLTVKDADGNVKFEIRYSPQSASYPNSLAIVRNGADSSSITLSGCNYSTVADRLYFSRWFHIAVTVGANGETGTLNDIKLYVNGTEKTLTGTATGTGAPLMFSETDVIYLAGTHVSDANSTKFSNTAIYGGKIEAADALERYTETLPYYETMFDSKLYDKYGEVITLEGVASVLTGNCGNFTVDVTEAAANVTEANFEIYNVTDDNTVDFALSNEGTVYTLSGFTLEANKDYKFIIKDITDANGNLIRTTQQVLDVHTAAPGDIKITAASVADDGTVSATVTNLSNSEKPAILIIASYSGDDLVDADYFDLGTLKIGEEFTPETVGVKGGSGITVKFMLWDNIDNVTPYHEAVVK